MSFRQSLNGTLDSNRTINRYDKLNQKTKAIRKQCWKRLLCSLFLGSFLTIFLNFITSVVGYGDAMRSLACTVIQYILIIFINNLMFSSFMSCVSQKCKESVFIHYIHFLVPQLVCGLILTVIQIIITNLLSTFAFFDSHIYIVISLIISLYFTLMNAMVSYQIFKEEKSISTILKKAFQILKNYWKELFLLSLMFITWSFFANIIVSQLVYEVMQSVNFTGNVFHVLLYLHEYSLLSIVVLFYIINFLFGGFLEIKVLLAVAFLVDYKDF